MRMSFGTLQPHNPCRRVGEGQSNWGKDLVLLKVRFIQLSGYVQNLRGDIMTGDAMSLGCNQLRGDHTNTCPSRLTLV